MKERKTRNDKNHVRSENNLGQSRLRENQTKSALSKKSVTKQKRAEQKSEKKEVCPYSKKCGGCTYIDISNGEQLAIKQKMVDKLLKSHCKVMPIVGMEQPYNYRNKIHAVFGRTRKNQIVSGIYEENSHKIIDIDKCMIENEKADEIIQDIKGLLKSFKIKTYDEDTGYGLLRHVLIRTGHITGQIMVVLVMSSPILPSKNNFVKALRKNHPEITTVVINVNDKKTSMVLGERDIVIYGKGYIEDVLCGQTYRISPQSFYQINPVQTEKLYNKAMEYADLKGNETVIDAYSGIGTIGMTAAAKAKWIISVELNKEAVKDAIQNAKVNGIKNIRFVCDDAGKFMVKMSEADEKVDVVFIDPPRSGSDEKFLSSLVRLSPKKVVYVSCNPVTLERDLCYLEKHGYKAEKACPFDMFPFTCHVEIVCLLGNRNAKPDTRVKLSVDTEELQRVKNGEKI